MKKSFVVLALSVAALTAGMAHGNPHQEIGGSFGHPSDVTRKCLECHAEAAQEMMKTSHWNWALKQEIGGRTIELGKKNAVNNFCIAVDSNWPRCTSCHISYGWKDASFDFNDPARMDCLVCHDTTGTYKKPGPAAGMPAGYTGNEQLDQKPVDLVKVAQNVGAPTRANCGVCHFFGGGGENVKHGDLDGSLAQPTAAIDVHMAADGLNFNCQQCHAAEGHNIKGNTMVLSPGGDNHITCTDCHQDKPHKNKKLNSHLAAVACQTCHIPFFAKERPTKLTWDWSTAGQDLEPSPDQYGKETYDKKKGNFTWGQNVQPVYHWYNGKAGVYLAGDKIDPAKVTRLAWPEGDIKDRRAKIYPFKVHAGKQIYDTKNLYFIKPKTWPTGNDDQAAYWKNYDWNKAAAAGMEAAGMAYSGEYGFAATEMYWLINHMVMPAKDALKCADCHGKGGRFNWQELGYAGDPMRVKGAARMK
jgi:octaheme c-type cytochrome (tetrathionate reductase family)